MLYVMNIERVLCSRTQMFSSLPPIENISVDSKETTKELRAQKKSPSKNIAPLRALVKTHYRERNKCWNNTHCTPSRLYDRVKKKSFSKSAFSKAFSKNVFEGIFQKNIFLFREAPSSSSKKYPPPPTGEGGGGGFPQKKNVSKV